MDRIGPAILIAIVCQFLFLALSLGANWGWAMILMMFFAPVSAMCLAPAFLIAHWIAAKAGAWPAAASTGVVVLVATLLMAGLLLLSQSVGLGGPPSLGFFALPCIPIACGALVGSAWKEFWPSISAARRS